MAKIDWLTGQPRKAIEAYLQWREVVVRADEGDNTSLVRLLRSKRILGAEARLLIADLLDRHKLRRKRGRPTTPAYRVTLAEARMSDVFALYTYFKRKQLSVDDAIQEALREKRRESLRLKNDREHTNDELDELISDEEIQALANRVGGRRASTNRIAKRRAAKPNRAPRADLKS